MRRRQAISAASNYNEITACSSVGCPLAQDASCAVTILHHDQERFEPSTTCHRASTRDTGTMGATCVSKERDHFWDTRQKDASRLCSEAQIGTNPRWTAQVAHALAAAQAVDLLRCWEAASLEQHCTRRSKQCQAKHRSPRCFHTL